MRRLLKFPNGETFFVDNMSIQVSGHEPTTKVDISDLPDKDVIDLIRQKDNKNIVTMVNNKIDKNSYKK